MPFPRASGILLHPTSFPSRFGIGDLGPVAYRFIDFLADSKQKFWQLLPLGPTGFGNSPYMSYSAMAGNPLLISPEELQFKGLLHEDDYRNLPEFSQETVDYDLAITVKMELLWRAYQNFQHQPQELFHEFCKEQAAWLDDYALFMAIKKVKNGDPWNTWEPALAKRKPEALEDFKQEYKDEINFRKYLEFEFARQWHYVKRYANDRGVKIIGDLPIYVAHDSADVWANPELFCLHPQTGASTLVAGVPPDYFSATGQLWGNPIYNWYQNRKQNYRWWVKRFQRLLELVDCVRIDHFRGFEAYWAVWGDEETAMNGRWIAGPRADFFKVIEDKLGPVSIIAEDLGDINEKVLALRDKFRFPGMKILQFAFGSDSGNPYLPHGYPQNCVVYTGTHDNDTTLGWFSQLSAHEQEAVERYIGRIDPKEIHWDLIRVALSSVADWAIIPLQDVLGLGGEHRMNTPGKAVGNWGWRYHWDALTKEKSDRLSVLTKTYGRA